MNAMARLLDDWKRSAKPRAVWAVVAVDGEVLYWSHSKVEAFRWMTTKTNAHAYALRMYPPQGEYNVP